jgi:hypothetical protein
MDDLPNFEVLRDPSSPDFLEELKTAHLFLRPDRASEFFEIVISHLPRSGLGPEIIRSISKVISLKSNCLSVFVSQSFAEQIPNLSAHRSEFLDLLSILVDRAPSAFTAGLASLFSRSITRAGEKSLILIARFSQKFNDVSDPWPMVDLLLSYNDRFSKPDIAGPYASLLGWLVATFPAWRRERGMQCWDLLLGILSATDINVREHCYSALARVAANVRRCAFPFEQMKAHARKYSILFPSIVALLLLVDLDAADSLSDMDFLVVLIGAARTEGAAPFALMRLAHSETIAAQLAKNGSWMAEELPRLHETLLLFLVVFQHQEVRERIVQCDQFYVLLNNLLGEPRYHTILAKVIRRVAALPGVAINLSERGLLEAFAKHAPIDQTLVIANRIAETGFVPGLVPICDVIAHTLSNGGDLVHDAITLAVQLAELERGACRRRMRDLRLPRTIRHLANDTGDPDIRRLARRFFSAKGIET